MAVVKHLAVLDRAGLVEPPRGPRGALHRRTERLDATARWMAGLAAEWDGAWRAIKRLAEGDQPWPASVGARMSRRSDQRRAAVFALYQHDVTGRELDDVLERDASTFTRALAYAAEDYARGPRRAASSATPRAGRSTASRRWRRRSCAIALLEMLHPDARRATTPIPPEGAIDEAVETAKALLRRRRARLRQRHPGRCPARDAARMARP